MRLRFAHLMLTIAVAAPATGLPLRGRADLLAPRAAPPSIWILGPIYGTGFPTWGDAGGNGKTMADEVNWDLDHLAQLDIPITCYHFDGNAWSLQPSGQAGDLWSLGPDLVQRLAAGNIRPLLHFWGGSPEMNFPVLGNVLGGSYLDEDATDALAKQYTDFYQAVLPGDGELVMKAYSNDGQQTDAGLKSYGHTCYVGDLPSDFAGLQEGIRRVFSKATLLPAPYNEFTGYDADNIPSEEVFFRRIHFGALQVVMDHSPWRDCDPWSHGYSPALLADYRYFAWLHWELGPYLHSYDYNAYETGAPIFRNTNADEFTTNLGDELFVPYVTQPGVTKLSVALPPGEWIDYWDEQQTYTGPARIEVPVPLGREPIFIRNGALIPMRVKRSYTGHGTASSDGSLTVLVYPKGTTTMRYRDEGYWVRFTSVIEGTALTLTQSTATTQPVIYRIERWDAVPTTVDVSGSSVTVNRGGAVPRLASEEAVNSSSVNAWFYDSAAHRVIIKMFPSGVVAPAVAIAYPAGGEAWGGLTHQTVKWPSKGVLNAVTVDLSTDGGVTWKAVLANQPNSGVGLLAVPDTPCQTCILRVHGLSGQPSTTSAPFAITAAPAPPALPPFVEDFDALPSGDRFSGSGDLVPIGDGVVAVAEEAFSGNRYLAWESALVGAIAIASTIGTGADADFNIAFRMRATADSRDQALVFSWVGAHGEGCALGLGRTPDGGLSVSASCPGGTLGDRAIPGLTSWRQWAWIRLVKTRAGVVVSAWADGKPESSAVVQQSTIPDVAAGDPSGGLVFRGDAGLAIDDVSVGTGLAKPLTPTNLVAAASGATQIVLSWVRGSDNEAGFRIERSAEGSDAWVQIATVGAGVTGFVDAEIAPSTWYFYRVRATNVIGDSAYSNVAWTRSAAGPARLRRRL